MATITRDMKEFAGVLIKDLTRYVPALLSGQADAHLTLRNRSESLEQAPDGSGFRCAWQWTSDLHAPKVIPALGRRLMLRALAAHPIRSASAPLPGSTEVPEISFLIGHRGIKRLSHLMATLSSIAAQQDVALECIVVEQDVHTHLTHRLPGWVRLVHTPPPFPEMPYCRSWAFNIAAQQARAPVLVLHDNDMLVPADYAAQILKRIRRSYDVGGQHQTLCLLPHASPQRRRHGRKVATAGQSAGEHRAKPGSRRQRSHHAGRLRQHRRHGPILRRLGRAFVHTEPGGEWPHTHRPELHQGSFLAAAAKLDQG